MNVLNDDNSLQEITCMLVKPYNKTKIITLQLES
jgi:hypothetical protein